MKKLLIYLFLFVFLFKGYSQNLVDPGFESLSLGVNSSTAWISSVAMSTGNSSPLCGYNTPYTQTNTTSIVVSTPTIDPLCGNVSNSPFSGNKVIALNKTVNGLGSYQRTRLRQNFQVSSTAYIYRYAYKGVLESSGNTLCDAGFLLFNFYDCNNSLITAFSRTVVATQSNITNIDGSFWALAPPTNAGAYNNYGIAYTPNWVMHSVNLSPYIGTCITVEVIASPCTCSAWAAYCYYDSECTDNMIETFGPTFPSTNGFLSCAASTSLSGTPGFTSYLWQGPVNSGISGVTSQAITASVTGAYSLAVTSGTLSYNKVIHLTIGAAVPIVSLTSSSASVCLGGSVTLQVSGSALSHTWSNNSNASFIIVTPTVSTVYSVLGINSFGCLAEDTKSIIMAPSPQLVQISSGASTICAGENVIMTATGLANTSYTWSGGSNNQTLSVSPIGATIYSVSATNTLGCVSSATKLISIFPYTPIQINLSNVAICANQTTSLNLATQGIFTYTWSTGLANQPLTVNPSITTVYSLTATNANGCNASTTATQNVLPLPVVQMVASNTAICLGQNVILTALPLQNYLYSWNNGSTSWFTSDEPTSNTVYNVLVSDAMGCIGTASLMVTVFPLPLANIMANDQICMGESITLSVTTPSINSYVWSNGSTGQSITVWPTASTLYEVTIIDINGCSDVTQKFVDLTNCTSIKTINKTTGNLLVFPNPTGGDFIVKGSESTNGFIVNALGQQVSLLNLNVENNFTQNFSGLVNGIYFLKTSTGITKIVVR